MEGNASSLKQVPTTNEDRWFYHGHDFKFVDDSPADEIPTSQLFSEGAQSAYISSPALAHNTQETAANLARASTDTRLAMRS